MSFDPPGPWATKTDWERYSQRVLLTAAVYNKAYRNGRGEEADTLARTLESLSALRAARGGLFMEHSAPEVHILAPWWDTARTEQVMSQAIRESHSNPVTDDEVHLALGRHCAQSPMHSDMRSPRVMLASATPISDSRAELDDLRALLVPGSVGPMPMPEANSSQD